MGNISRLVGLFALAAVSVADTCNPLNTRCPPNVGLANSTYAIDFTQQTSIPPDWTLSNYASIKFGSKGAEFTVAKRFDSPQLRTNFYIHYGKTEVVAQVAPGTGIVSSAVLMSDDLDEIDWEWSGNNFGDTVAKGQNNYYGKGITGNYDRGSFFNVASPQTQFHTYTVDWTPTSLTWSVDGTIVRAFYASQADSGSHQYPQSPARFQLGIWAGGDPGNAWGTVDWAGGYTDFTQAPFTMYVKSVKITNYNPAYAYNYTDNSGSSNSIQYLSKPVVSPSSTATAPSSSSSVKVSTTCAGVPPSAPTQSGIVSGCTQWYTAKSGDTCLTISAKFNISNTQFMAWNPAVNPPLCYNMWLNYGYCVSTDCSLVSTSSTMVSTTSSTTSSRSSSVTSSTSVVSTIVVSSTLVPTTTISSTSNTSTSRSSSSSSSSSTTSPVLSSTTTSRSSSSTSTSQPPSSSLPSVVIIPQSTTASSSSTAPSATSSIVLCPGSDGQSLTSRGSNAYTINCASDSSQGSYAVTYALHSYLDCLNLCDEAASTGCTAFTYVGGSKGTGSGICYLKSASGTFSAVADNYISGALSAKNSSGSSTTQTGSSTSSTASSTVTATTSLSVLPLASPAAQLCPDAETQSFVNSQGGSLFFMRCSSDTNIGSYSNSMALTSWKDCMNSCESDPRCVAFTYVGGNKGLGSGVCWYKDNKGQAVIAGPNYVAGFLAVKAVSPGSSVTSISTGNVAVSSGSPTTSSSTSSTSTASTSWATNSAGSNYTIYRGSDTNYGAYNNVPATDSFLDCTTACDKDPNCKAWTYVGASGGNGSGTCWLKSQLGQPVPSNNNGIISGSRLTQGVRMRRAVSSWWNSVTSVKPTATKTQRVATTIPKAPPHPAWARFYPHGGRWMWNGHGDWEWAWN